MNYHRFYISLILIGILLSSTLIVEAQTPYNFLSLQSPYELGEVRDATSLADGGMIIVGRRGTQGEFSSSEAVAQRYDAQNKLLWERTFGDPETQTMPLYLELTPNDDVAIVLEQRHMHTRLLPRLVSTSIWRITSDGTDLGAVFLFEGDEIYSKVDNFVTDGEHYYLGGFEYDDTFSRGTGKLFAFDSLGNEFEVQAGPSNYTTDAIFHEPSQTVIGIHDGVASLFSLDEGSSVRIDRCSTCYKTPNIDPFSSISRSKQIAVIDSVIMYMSSGIGANSAPILTRLNVVNINNYTREDIVLPDSLSGYQISELLGWGQDSLLLSAATVNGEYVLRIISAQGELGRELPQNSPFVVGNLNDPNYFIRANGSKSEGFKFIPSRSSSFDRFSFPQVLDGLTGNTLAKISDARDGINSNQFIYDCAPGKQGNLYCLSGSYPKEHLDIEISTVSASDGSVISRQTIEVKHQQFGTTMEGIKLILGSSLTGTTTYALEYNEYSNNEILNKRLAILDEDMNIIKDIDLFNTRYRAFSPVPDGGYLTARYVGTDSIGFSWLNERDGVSKRKAFYYKNLLTNFRSGGDITWLSTISAGPNGIYSYALTRRLAGNDSDTNESSVILRDRADEILYEYTGSGTPNLYTHAIAPDGKLLIVGSENTADASSTPYMLLDPADGYESVEKGTFKLSTEQAVVSDIAFNHDGSIIVAWSEDVTNRSRAVLSRFDLSDKSIRELYRAPGSSIALSLNDFVSFHPRTLDLKVGPTGVVNWFRIGRNGYGVIAGDLQELSPVIDNLPLLSGKLGAQSPFTTQIHFSFPSTFGWALPRPTLRDLQGRLIALGQTRSVQDSRDAARYSTEVSASLPSGVYILSVGGQSKMVVKY